LKKLERKEIGEGGKEKKKTVCGKETNTQEPVPD
jgi:hypothetical protein